jgi:DNA polymerase I-like protein with 3'-5' exonuclease and polymerase domains
MQNVTLDFETFYDPANKYSLSCMSTEDYVADDRFEVILVSWMVDDGEVQWFSGDYESTKDRLLQLDLHKKALTAHHARFDASVLAQQFNIHPRHIYCTEYMANPSLKPRMKSLGLKALADHFGLPPKGDEVHNVMGMRRSDFTSYALERYALYGSHDTWLGRQLFLNLLPRLSADELRILDMTLRMYIQPQLVLDEAALQKGLAATIARKVKMLSEMEVQGITKKALGSSKQFAQILRDRGIDPPLKESPAFLKKDEAYQEANPDKRWTYAFGKTDPEMLQLKEDFAEDEEITAILDARTEAKSTQEESRCTKFIEKARKHHVLRAAIAYYSTHTGRYGGDEGENVLNLTNVGKYKDKKGDTQFKSYLRFGFAAPPGKKVVAIDYSQIEARITATTAGQQDLIAQFARNEDVYSIFAADLYGRPVSKELAENDPQAEKDRKSGKETILGAGFGMGWRKFKRTVRGKGLVLTDEEAEQTIKFYRSRYPMIPEQWNLYTAALNDLLTYKEDVHVGAARFTWDNETDVAIVLPNNMRLLYPNIKAVKKKDKTGVTFQRARDKFPQHLWGGVVMNNWAQSTAGIIIRRAMGNIHRELLGARPALQIYDELLYVVDEDEAEEFKDMASEIMVREVEWMPDLPIAVEAKIGQSYGHV